jgi:hypothetical protein
MGVGCVYLKGDKFEELPKEPIQGIRLVFLDMRLDEGGDQKSALSKTVKVLSRCVSANALPLIILCWTRHPDDVEVFRKMVGTEMPDLRPVLIERMEKPTGSKPEKWTGQIRRIEKTLRENSAVGVLWRWEKVLHEAASNTSETLAGMPEDTGGNANTGLDAWQDGMFSLFQELVKAEAGKVHDEKLASDALFRILNELAVDWIHYFTLQKPLSCGRKLIPQGTAILERGHAAKLNQMLLIEAVGPSDRTIRPGNVYLPLAGQSRGCLHRKVRLDNELLLESILQGTDSGNARPILIEISPACDFSQDKRPVCTFIAGLLIPEDALPENPKRDDLHLIGPLCIPGEDIIHKMVVSKRFIFGLSLQPNAVRNSPAFRLRSQVLVDLQLKAAAHRARPGVVCLTLQRKKKQMSPRNVQH